MCGLVVAVESEKLFVAVPSGAVAGYLKVYQVSKEGPGASEGENIVEYNLVWVLQANVIPGRKPRSQTFKEHLPSQLPTI